MTYDYTDYTGGTKVTPEQAIAESRAIEEGATPGPWVVEIAKRAGQYNISPETVGTMTRFVACSVDGNGCGAITSASDARELVHARNTHRLLLDVAEAAVEHAAALNDIGEGWMVSDDLKAALRLFAEHVARETGKESAAYVSGENSDLFPCCGGNDASPPGHCMDCPDHGRNCPRHDLNDGPEAKCICKVKP